MKFNALQHPFGRTPSLHSAEFARDWAPGFCPPSGQGDYYPWSGCEDALTAGQTCSIFGWSEGDRLLLFGHRGVSFLEVPHSGPIAVSRRSRGRVEQLPDGTLVIEDEYRFLEFSWVPEDRDV